MSRAVTTSCISLKCHSKWNSKANHNVRGELKLSKVQLKEKIRQKAAKPGKKTWQKAHGSFCGRAPLSIEFVTLAFALWAGSTWNPPARGFGLEMFSSKAMGNRGIGCTCLDKAGSLQVQQGSWAKVGAATWPKLTGHVWSHTGSRRSRE